MGAQERTNFTLPYNQHTGCFFSIDIVHDDITRLVINLDLRIGANKRSRCVVKICYHLKHVISSEIWYSQTLFLQLMFSLKNTKNEKKGDPCKHERFSLKMTNLVTYPQKKIRSTIDKQK